MLIGALPSRRRSQYSTTGATRRPETDTVAATPDGSDFPVEAGRRA
jgi:hypothetical protein